VQVIIPHIGISISLSSDGNVLAVGDTSERSIAIGINGNQQDLGNSSGAAYVFTRSTNWAQIAYVKASNTGLNDDFGNLILSGDGSILVVGAPFEDAVIQALFICIRNCY